MRETRTLRVVAGEQGSGERDLACCLENAAQALAELAVMLPARDVLRPPAVLFARLLAARAPSADLRQAAL